MNKDQLLKRLAAVEKQLDKCRTTVREDGWQTQRHARKSRKWDYYAREKHILLELLEDVE
jgi:hypothetical protein